MFPYRSTISYGALLALMSSSAAVAQDNATVTEIIVTAERRSENLQRTPVAISALSAETVEKLGIRQVTDLGNIAPNLNILPGTSTSVGSVITLRGIATPTDEMMTLDTPVGLYIDGVYLARSGASAFDVGDIERIEVLRGPQGSLFGRNTTGGAVNFITRQPAEDFGVVTKLGIGSFDARNARLTLDTGRLADVARLSLTYVHRQRDGLTKNILASDSHSPGAQNIDAVRAALALDLSDNFTTEYVFDYSDRKAQSMAFQMVNANETIRTYLANSSSLGGRDAVIQQQRVDQIALDNDGGSRDKIWGHMVRSKLDLGDIAVKSTTAFRGWNSRSRSDLDGLGGIRGLLFSGDPYDPTVGDIGLFHSSNSRRQRQFSQEIELSSQNDGPLQWVAGAFYFTEKGQENAPQVATAILDVRSFLDEELRDDFPVELALQGFRAPSRLQYHSKSRSFAIFGQASYRPEALDDRLGLTVGMRYNWDKKSINETLPFVLKDSVTFEEPTGSASLDFRANRDLNFYARVARGYRSGGYSVRTSQDPFLPESLWSYEVGVKSELFNNRLRLNAAAFLNNYDDQQISQPVLNTNGTFGQVVVNAGKTRYKGVEIEAVAVPTSGLTLSGNFGYVDIDILKFSAFGGDISDIAKPQNAPSFTANASVEYGFDWNNVGKVSLRGDWNYRSQIYFFATPVGLPFFDETISGARSLFDAQLRIDDIKLNDGANLSVTAFVKNAANKKHKTRAIDFGALGYAGVWYGEPRTYGLELTVRL